MSILMEAHVDSDLIANGDSDLLESYVDADLLETHGEMRDLDPKGQESPRRPNRHNKRTSECKNNSKKNR